MLKAIGQSAQIPINDNNVVSVGRQPILMNTATRSAQQLINNKLKHLTNKNSDHPALKRFKAFFRFILWVDLGRNIIRGVRGLFNKDLRSQGSLLTFLLEVPLINSLFSTTVDNIVRAYRRSMKEMAFQHQKALDIEEGLEKYCAEVTTKGFFNAALAASVKTYRHNKMRAEAIENAIATYYKIKHGPEWFAKDIIVDRQDNELAIFIQPRRRDFLIEYYLEKHLYEAQDALAKYPEGMIGSATFYYDLSIYRNKELGREQRNLALADLLEIYYKQKLSKGIRNGNLEVVYAYYCKNPPSDKVRNKKLNTFLKKYQRGKIKLDDIFQKQDICQVRRVLEQACNAFNLPTKSRRERERALTTILKHHEIASYTALFKRAFDHDPLDEDLQQQLSFLLLFEAFSLPYTAYFQCIDPLKKNFLAAKAAAAYRYYAAEKAIAKALKQYVLKLNDSSLRYYPSFRHHLDILLVNTSFYEELEAYYKEYADHLPEKLKQQFAIFFGVVNKSINERDQKAALHFIINALKKKYQLKLLPDGKLSNILITYDKWKDYLSITQKAKSLAQITEAYNVEKEARPISWTEDALEKIIKVQEDKGTPYYGITPLSANLKSVYKANFEREESQKKRRRLIAKISIETIVAMTLITGFLFGSFLTALFFALVIITYLIKIENREADKLIANNRSTRNILSKLNERLSVLGSAAKVKGHPDHKKFLYYSKELEIQKNLIRINQFTIGIKRTRAIFYTIGVTLGLALVFFAPTFAPILASIIFASVTGLLIVTALSKISYKKKLQKQNSKLKLEQPASPREAEGVYMQQSNPEQQSKELTELAAASPKISKLEMTQTHSFIARHQRASLSLCGPSGLSEGSSSVKDNATEESSYSRFKASVNRTL